MSLVSHEPYAEKVNELVCLDMPNGPLFIDRVRRAWDDGDAIFPLDQRLPTVAKRSLVDQVAPTLICSTNGETTHTGRHTEDGDAVVVATSGTTGQAKAVILTMNAVEASARATSQRLGVRDDDCWLACLPPAHVGGLSVILRSIIMGTKVIAIPAFSVEGYNEASDAGATLVSLVATALQRVDASRYRTIVLGGAKPPENRPLNCVTTYGLTETGSGIVYDGVPLDDVEVQIRESVVYVRGPMLMRAYRDGTTPLDSEGWLRTGDKGSLSSSGALSIDGREGDLIITGGENVWPDVVEYSLRAHSAIQDVCVAGVVDSVWGHAVHAWVVATPGVSVSLEELRDHVKETLPAHCAPQYVHFISEIPRTALGKPQRNLLIAKA